MAKVSVIVPVYNAGRFLRECAESLVNQTLTDIELIFVNDGSTDDSVDILYECERKNRSRIIVIDCAANAGPGGARNIGMTYARGDYIGFVDSDDVAEPTMFEKLYNRAVETGADVVDCGYYMKEQDMAIVHTGDTETGELDAGKRSRLIAGGGYVWSKLYKKRLLSGVTFREKCILEDADFLAYIFATAKTIQNVKEVLYQYRDVSDIQTHRQQDPYKYNDNLIKAMRAVHDRTCTLSVYEGIREAVEYEIIDMYDRAILNTANDRKHQNKLNTYAVLRDLAIIKASLVEGDYDNKYVQAKISPFDIELMKKNDRDPKLVINML